MGLHIESDELVIDCSGCNIELERIESQASPRLFKKQFVILCMDCLTRIQSGRWSLKV